MNTEKAKTVVYTTDTGRYMHWEFFNRKNILSYKSWIKSGNACKINGKTYTKNNIKELEAVK